MFVTRNDVPWELPFKVDPGKIFVARELPGRCLDEGGLYLIEDQTIGDKCLPKFFRNGRQLEQQFFAGMVRLKQDGDRWVPVPEVRKVSKDQKELPPAAPVEVDKNLEPLEERRVQLQPTFKKKPGRPKGATNRRVDKSKK